MLRLRSILPLLFLAAGGATLLAQESTRGSDWPAGLMKCDAALRTLLLQTPIQPLAQADEDSQSDKIAPAEKKAPSGTKSPARGKVPRTDKESGNADTMRIEFGVVRLVIRGDAATLVRSLRRSGIAVDSIFPGLATASVPLWRIPGVAAIDAVERIEAAQGVELFNDSLRMHIRADAVHCGAPPLKRGYTGQGVIIGIIDSGIDFRHPEFRMAADTTRTRIISIWDQSDATGPHPSLLPNGTEWTREQIDDELRGVHSGRVRHRDRVGHGTQVASIAAGRTGVAPDAELIVVSLRDNATLSTDVVRAASYIYRKAAALGRPCVINASLGTYEHAYDGSDVMSWGLDRLVAESPGRFFCAAAGNGGRYATHWGGFPAERDSLWIYTNAPVRLRVPDTALESFEISIALDTGSVFGRPARPAGQSPWRSAGAIRGTTGTIDRFLRDSSGRGGSSVLMAASALGNGYSELLITPKMQSSSFLVRVMVRGSAVFHAWSDGFIDHERAGPFDNRYRSSDNAYGIAAPAIARQVLAIGSSVNRSGFSAWDDENLPVVPLNPGALSDFSSHGPSVDGRVKPEIVAPGEIVLAARSRDMWWAPPNLTGDTTYLSASGTSMSSPAAAGAVALYMEGLPNAGASEIREAITRLARHDMITDDGQLSDGRWGYGRLDIFKMISGGGDTNPADPCGTPARGVVSLRNGYPNPSSGTVTIDYHIENPGSVRIDVFNQLGEIMLTTGLPHRTEGWQSYRIEVGAWPEGAYHYRLSTADGAVSGEWVVVR